MISREASSSASSVGVVPVDFEGFWMPSVMLSVSMLSFKEPDDGALESDFSTEGAVLAIEEAMPLETRVLVESSTGRAIGHMAREGRWREWN